MADRLPGTGHPAVTGAIVAGGQSQRFGGKPKGLATVAGLRIIDRVAGALREVVQDFALNANQPDAAHWLIGIPLYQDERSERGSLVGLHTAISRAPGPVLVVAWDMPFVTPELFELIIGELEPGVSAVVPEGPHGLEPMCAVYTRGCLPTIERALDRGELRLGSVLAQLPGLVRIPVDRVSTVGDAARLFFNVNSPADLEVAEQMARTR